MTQSDAGRTVTIVNQKGLHARASANFAAVAERFEADITVSKGGETVPATSIMGLLMLGAAKGSAIDIAATGADAMDAIEALAQFVENAFEEEDFEGY